MPSPPSPVRWRAVKYHDHFGDQFTRSAVAFLTSNLISKVSSNSAPASLDGIRVFIQARMSSSRLPGKMLAPFRGLPLIEQMLKRFEHSPLQGRLVVITSTHRTDDPLADYVEKRCKNAVFRGELDDVVGRFQAAIRAFPCAWAVRLSGDSPLMEAALVERMLGFVDGEYDLVTNVARRTFPPGQSVECIKASTLQSLRSSELSPAQREHVTKVFYDDRAKWNMRSVVSKDESWRAQPLVVDSLDDLKRLEHTVELPPSFAALAVLDGAT
jgi:spore coat polysaccharide biosynthesis protein SpsF